MCANSRASSSARADRYVDEALLLQSQIAKLSRPHKRVLDAYKHWFIKPYPLLGGRAKTFLDAADDLVALNTSPESDYLSLFLRRHWPAKAGAALATKIP